LRQSIFTKLPGKGVVQNIHPFVIQVFIVLDNYVVETLLPETDVALLPEPCTVQWLSIPLRELLEGFHNITQIGSFPFYIAFDKRQVDKHNAVKVIRHHSKMIWTDIDLVHPQVPPGIGNQFAEFS
jgi:predicted AAA+ superfamily ATPase